MEKEQMKKELGKFESEIKSGDTKGILYKVDFEMEGRIRMDFLIEKYGEEKINSILSETEVSVTDLAIEGVFNKISEIAES